MNIINGVVETAWENKIGLGIVGSFALGWTFKKVIDSPLLDLFLPGFSSRVSIPRTAHETAAIGDVENLKRLLKGKDPDTVDRNGMTPLMHAAKKGHRSVVELLLNMGANPELFTRSGETALHLAAIENAQETANLLIERGAPLNHRDSKGKTPAMYALERGYYPLFKEMAMAEKFDSTVCDFAGRNILHYAAKTRRSDVIQTIPNRKDLKDVADQKGFTPLDLLCGAGEISLKGFDELFFSEIFESMDKKRDALVKAFARLSDRDRHAIIEEIKGFRKFNSNRLKAIEDPLYFDPVMNYYPMRRALQALKTPPEAAHDLHECVKLLGPLNPKALFTAIESGRQTIAEAVLKDRSFDPNLRKEGDVPLVLHALSHGQIEIARKFAGHPRFNPKLTDANGNTIVHAAAKAGALDFIRKYESLAVIPNRKGQRPLETAVKEGKSNCIDLLVERTDGVLRLIWKEDRLTPIEYAVVTGNEVLRKALNKKKVFFKYEGDPERYHRPYLQQLLAILTLIVGAAGIKTEELLTLKEEIESYLQGNKSEPTEYFAQILLGIKQSLERAQLSAEYREKNRGDTMSGSFAQGLSLIQSILTPKLRELILPYLHTARRCWYKEEDTKRFMEAELPLHPAFEFYQEFLAPFVEPMARRATSFRRWGML